MTIRGQRFELNLDDSDEEPQPKQGAAEASGSSAFDFLGRVTERQPAAAPKPPTQRNTKDGFPSHRKREVVSRFKKSRAPQDNNEVKSAGQHENLKEEARGATTPSSGAVDAFMAEERRRIDQENKETLASMSQQDIDREREELLQSLDPSLLQRLLGRATINPGGDDADFPGLEEAAPTPVPAAKAAAPKKRVAFAEPSPDVEDDARGDAFEEVVDTEDAPSTSGPQPDEAAPGSTVHFPHAPQPPSLDPSSANFLTDLHEKYFPSLPSDPSKLEWMTAPTPKESTYSTTASSLDPKDIRFSFTGTLLPPSVAARIPVTAGLHHHGNAPDAAGYTIPELAILERSTVAAQRCVALQTLGRILYRLGKGEFGNPGDGGEGTVGAEDTMGELARGLWGEVEKEGVIEVMVAESEGNSIAGGKHVSARAYATEAVWLWRQGGGRQRKAA